ncbi:MAG TPA: pyrimidine/purine nucleoside phosphorylase [Candidatus Omnitrophota bacterium]|nr:pyrimidine/purine nucleoside phosphorylase [Candidatus Omnitrophota bacterium]
MVKVNEYFDGKVKSMVVNSSEGKKTVGVMEAGEYEFTTSSEETMLVVDGVIKVILPGEEEWDEFGAGSSFTVPADSKFKVQVDQDTAYLCKYE